jgi:nickel-dependent lactate racemase
MSIEIGLDHTRCLSCDEVNNKIFDLIDRSVLLNKKVLIVCEDNTRSTPIDTFFPEFINRLDSLDANVQVLFALGTHRPMRREEMLRKLGISEERASSIPLINHNAFDDSQMIEVGSIDGRILRLNNAIVDADTIITISSVLPHRVVGFSGGAKMLSPGISNKSFIDYSHYKSTFYPEMEIIGKIDNPMRDLINKQAEIVSQKFPNKKFVCISAITTADGIADVFVGSFQESYKQAAELSKRLLIKEVEQPESILAILDDKSTDFWQAAKAIYNTARVLKDGGTIVIRGRLEDGISATHANDILRYGYSDPETIKKLFESGKITNQVAASHMIRVSEYLQRVNIVLSSENVSKETCKRANLGYISPDKVVPSNFDLIVHEATDILLQKGKDKLVLTGSTGNVGSKLIDALAQNYKLFEIDLNFNEDEKSGRLGFRCDVANLEQLKAIFEKLGNVKYIVHLAGDSSVNATWESTLHNNIIGTHNVYEVARQHNVQRVIYASSNHVTGGYEKNRSNVSGMIEITDSVKPDGDYATSKVFGEAVARQYYELYGIESICIRIGTVISDDLSMNGDRIKKTWLSKRDLQQLVLKALMTPVKYGVYYGVSNNKDRLWDISNARKELDYNPEDDASLI